MPREGATTSGIFRTKGAAAMVKAAHRDCVGHATLTYRKIESN
jgi:hypothetical protein